MTKLDRIRRADDFVRGYLSAVTFVPYCENDASPPWLRPGTSHEPADYELAKWCSLGTIRRAIRDCADFCRQTAECLGLDLTLDEQAGSDFFFTRERHGCGFWDGDWPEIGDTLTDISRGFGSVEPMYWRGLVRTY